MVFRCREAPPLEARLLLMKGKAIAQSTATGNWSRTKPKFSGAILSLPLTHLYSPPPQWNWSEQESLFPVASGVCTCLVERLWLVHACVVLSGSFPCLVARFWLLPVCFVLSDSFPSVIGVRVCLVTRFLPSRVCSVLSDPFQCGSFDQKTKMDVRKDEVKWWLICHWQERRETMQNWVN